MSSKPFDTNASKPQVGPSNTTGGIVSILSIGKVCQAARSFLFFLPDSLRIQEGIHKMRQYLGC